MHINLLSWSMMLVDSSYSQVKAIKSDLRDQQMSPLTTLFPIISHQTWYFASSHRQKRRLTRMRYKLNAKTPIQKDLHSYGDWVITSLQWLISSKDHTLKANAIGSLRKKFILEIFANSISSEIF